MIRFVDLRNQGIGERFAFWTTIKDHFLMWGGDQAWTNWREFQDSYKGQELDRYRGLCPPWVFDNEVDDVVSWMGGDAPPTPGAREPALSPKSLDGLQHRVLRVLLAAGYVEGYHRGDTGEDCEPEANADENLAIMEKDGSVTRLLELIELGYWRLITADSMPQVNQHVLVCEVDDPSSVRTASWDGDEWTLYNHELGYFVFRDTLDADFWRPLPGPGLSSPKTSNPFQICRPKNKHPGH